MKTCKVCLETKPLTEFKEYHAKCKICFLAHRRAQRKADSQKWKDHRKQKRYGLQPGQFEKICQSQNNTCSICNKTAKLVVDHCHETGIFRGVICGRCNSVLGFAKDNIETLQSAINYLVNFTKKKS